MRDPASKQDPPGGEGPADPRLRRAVSRRSLITRELKSGAAGAARHLPSVAPLIGLALKEPPAVRDGRLLRNLWQLFLGREPKPEERDAGLQLLRAARSSDDKADALVDVMWALGQTTEFEELKRPDRVLVRGLYRLALDREPGEEELVAALGVLAEAAEPGARVAALEGLFTGLLRRGDSVVRR